MNYVKSVIYSYFTEEETVIPKILSFKLTVGSYYNSKVLIIRLYIKMYITGIKIH